MNGSRGRVAWARAVRLCAAVALVLLWLASPGRATAAPRRTAIALVQGGAGPELGARLRAELTAVGWRVLDVDSKGEVALAKIARRAGTLAVIRVGQEAEGIEIWVAPEVDAQARNEWIDVQRTRPDLAVVLAVESLRARFLELGIEPEGVSAPASSAAPAPAPVPPPELPPNLPPSHLPLWIGATGALMKSPGGVDAGGFVGAHLRVVPVAAWGFGVEVWWPPSTLELRGDEGSSEVRVALAAASAEYRHERERFTGALGAGAALAALDLRGRPSSGYVGRSDRILTALPFARLALELALTRRLRLRVAGMIGISAPRAVIVFDERSAATWGRPLTSAALGLDWAVLDPD